MSKIFTIPLPCELDSPILKSLSEGIKVSKFNSYSIKTPKQINTSEQIFVWGIAEHSKSIWEKASEKDFLFFYYKGKIKYYSRIILKAKSEELASELWDVHLNNRIKHPYLLLLDSLSQINLPYSVLIDYAGYSTKASVRRFYEYSNKGFEQILNDFNSVENFICNYKN
jgi:hypothetical protein